MRPLRSAPLWLFALAVLAGCASTKVTSQQPYEGPKIARPDRIIVYDFAATPADVPAGSAVVSEYSVPSSPKTPEQIATGRKLGAEVARDLVTEIQNMGLPAVLAAGQPPPKVGDLVIMGYFVTVQQGSAAERVLIGFGSGAADLKTVVEGYLMTAQGLRRLGGGELDSGGGRVPAWPFLSWSQPRPPTRSASSSVARRMRTVRSWAKRRSKGPPREPRRKSPIS